MATFETFTYKGKDYKFRIGREAPEVKPLTKYSSDYYKGKQKSLAWAMWLTFVPVIALGIIYFAYINSNNPKGALDWFPILALPYGMVIYTALDKIGDTDKILVELKKHAEDEEHLDAYRAWLSRRQ